VRLGQEKKKIDRYKETTGQIYNGPLLHRAAITIAGSLRMLITSPAGAVAKYCDEYVCLWVCPSVCPPANLRNHTRDLYQIFVHVPYVRGSVLLRHVYDRPHRLSPGMGFLPHRKCIIGRKRGMECTARAKYTVCYLRVPCGIFIMVQSTADIGPHFVTHEPHDPSVN